MNQDQLPFRIRPLRPLSELIDESIAATPPQEAGAFRAPELADLACVDAGLCLDVRYATADNFLGVPVYASGRALLQRPAVGALLEAHQRLERDGLGLVVYDAYRPWSVTWLFWEATPEEYRGFVANPKKGSRHNRGCAVDVGLYHLDSGAPAEMPCPYDEFSERAYPTYTGGSARALRNRDLLRSAMEAAGYTVNVAEWWHYDFADWPLYPILNVPANEV